MSYGVGEGHQWRRAATYVDRILKGARQSPEGEGPPS